MKVVKDLVTPDKYAIKCPYNMTAEFFVVHNTANDASAENEIAYMKRNNNLLSFHYAIDDKEVRQGVALDRNGFHAGDGANGDGNRKGIGIEICYSKSGGDKFIKAERNAAEFIAQELKKRKWGIDKVKKHQDFSGKYCPHRTLDMGWQRFLDMIEAEMTEEKTETLYRVQVGAFAKKENAEKYLAKVKAAGFDAYIVSVDGLYKIQVGAFAVKANAEAYLAKVEKKGFDGFITTKSGKAVSAKKSVDEIAMEVIAGKWGNGTARVQALTKAGYDANAVQEVVNKLL